MKTIPQVRGQVLPYAPSHLDEASPLDLLIMGLDAMTGVSQWNQVLLSESFAYTAEDTHMGLLS